MRPIIVWPRETAKRLAPVPPISRPRQGVVHLPAASFPKRTSPSQKTRKTVPELASDKGRWRANSVRPNRAMDKAIA